jgi:hypothetical protein
VPNFVEIYASAWKCAKNTERMKERRKNERKKERNQHEDE